MTSGLWNQKTITLCCFKLRIWDNLWQQPQETNTPRNGQFHFFFFFFLGPYLLHMEVARLGVKSELQLPAYTTATATPDALTHWARPGIKCTSSWILVGFLTRWATMGTPIFLISLKGKEKQQDIKHSFIKEGFHSLRISFQVPWSSNGRVFPIHK